MSRLKEFSYSDVNQRRLIYAGSLLSSVSIAFILTDYVYSLKYYFYYFPVSRFVFFIALCALFLGNLAGKLLFSRMEKGRVLIIIVDVLFILAAVPYLLRFYLLPGIDEPIMYIFSLWMYAIPLYIFILLFLVGIKINYFLKVSCGDFIDEKQGLVMLLSLMLLGFLLGLGISSARFLLAAYIPWSVMNAAVVIFPVLMIPLTVILRLSYNPSPMFARHFEEETESREEEIAHRDDLFFTYLNFSYIFMYVYLGYVSFIKFYGDIYYIKFIFLGVILFSALAGFILSRFFRLTSWHIYAEMLFPVFFLSYVFVLYRLGSLLPFYYGMCLFVAPAIFFSFVILQNINTLMANFDHKRRFRIIDFSLLILPVPLLAVMALTEFTYLWYFILIYVLTFLNIIIPGLYLVNRQMKNYKKAVYFIFALLFIPVIIVMHVYFKIPLNSDIYVSRMHNFREIKSTNINALYIKTEAMVTMNGFPVFKMEDSIIRNMKRAFIAIAMHHEDMQKRILIIDGNQKFFRNPIFAYFRNALCVDPLSEENVDHNRLPIAGEQLYFPDEQDLMIYLYREKRRFRTIVDNPNLLDQTVNEFRFSRVYYAMLKERLEEGGMFIQTFHTSLSDPALVRLAVKNMDDLYKNHIVYLFSDILVVLSSDSDFRFSENNRNLILDFMQNKKELKNLFFDETQLYSHLLFTDLGDLARFLPEDQGKNIRRFRPVTGKSFADREIYDLLGSRNDAITGLVSQDQKGFYFGLFLRNALARNADILSKLKKTELAEAEKRYEDETTFLFDLKRYTEYMTELRSYLNVILSYKEEYYFNAALRLEKDRNWEGAKTLYRAILIINKDNFEANYRLGLLCLTLQDLDNSFIYLQNAMKLRKDHPKVLYLMGVLYFSMGKIQDAIQYLNQSLQQREKNSSIFLYLGLSYEKLGNLAEARVNYEKALLEDPNDVTIQARIDGINKKNEDEKNKWKVESPKNAMEDEKDEEMPLPINKSAYEIRLGDEENKTEQK